MLLFVTAAFMSGGPRSITPRGVWIRSAAARGRHVCASMRRERRAREDVAGRYGAPRREPVELDLKSVPAGRRGTERAKTNTGFFAAFFKLAKS